MKPISLSIKGLNSFEDEQYIDFINLTKNGFFGIFGPTGSGKSTILDGICLALYGEIPRGNVNFINLNSERTYVDFEFQISGEVNKKYKVSREFKRNKKTNTIESGKCKVVDITNDEIEVLAELVTGTTKKCQEIIGLKKEDFLRTVVLPQGKFSEFLKLTGAKRNDMLQRLFNLFEYGDDLKNKLKNSREIEDSRLNRIKGELQGIGSIEPEDIKNQEDLVKSKKKEYDLAGKECEILGEKLKDQTEIYAYQTEIKSYSSELDKLLSIKPDIDNKAVSLATYNNANQIKDIIVDFEKNTQELDNCNNKIAEIKIKKQESFKNKTEIEDKYNVAKLAHDNELPKLLISKENYSEALEKIKALKILNNKINECKIQEEELTSKISKLKADKEAKDKELTNLKTSIEETASFINDLKINPSYRSGVERGYQLSKELIKDSERKSKTVTEYDKLAKDLEGNNKLLGELNIKLDELKNQELAIQKEMNSLKEKPIGNHEDLIKLNDKKNLVTNAWKIKEDNSKCIENNINEIKESSKAREELVKIRDEQRASLEEFKINREKAKIENLALELRRSLKHGENCPVCGGLDHPYLHDDMKNLDEFYSDIDMYEKKIEQLSNTISEYDNKINKLDTDIIVLTKKIEDDKLDIESLDKSLLEFSPTDLKREADILGANIINFEKKKNKLELSEKECLREKASNESNKSSVLSKLEGISSRLESLDKEIIEQSNNIKFTEDKLAKLKIDFKVDDFESEYNKISEMASKLEDYEKEKAEKEKAVTRTEALFKNIEKEINPMNNELVALSTRKESLENSYNEQKTSLISKVGDLDLVEGCLSDIELKITNIKSSYKELDELKIKVESEYNSLNEDFIKEEQKKIGLDSRNNDTKNIIQKKLVELSFDSIDTVKSNFKEQVEIDNIAKEIKEYETKLAQLNSIIQSLKSKLGDRSVDEEEFKKLEQDLEEKKLAVSELNNNYILENQKLKQLKTRLESIKEVLERENKVEKKLAILKDLESLFKGNKFVEFLATERLKYVSREASTRLLDITGGSYGIETDDSGKFFIKDNKNGGVLRESSTLSGGETFLASLALALSLSAEIQLKGTAPLELFFLDEGFGTLDDNLLEVLMSSLEKIHNEKLKIGLISHVESVKQRVPVKLIVTPSKSGICGSTIKIEHN